MQLLWALADHCPEALSALEAHNLELGQPACLAGSPWGSVLVSHCLLISLAKPSSLSDIACSRNASHTALQDPSLYHCFGDTAESVSSSARGLHLCVLHHDSA